MLLIIKFLLIFQFLLIVSHMFLELASILPAKSSSHINESVNYDSLSHFFKVFSENKQHFAWIQSEDLIRKDGKHKSISFLFPWMCLLPICHFYCLNTAIHLQINKMQAEDIECVFESMSASGSIYISNYSAAQNLQLLQSKGIKAIISVARSGLINHSKDDIPHYLYIPAQDREDYPMHQHFNQTYDFIQKARKSCNVLVHCMVGVSRSVTIVIAYLLKKYKYTLGQVISMIQRKRRKLNPNKGFIEQLKKFSETEGIKCDFHESSVPKIRERSASRQMRSFSANKSSTPSKKNQDINPFAPQQKINKKTGGCQIDPQQSPNKQNIKQKAPEKHQKQNQQEDQLILKKLCNIKQVKIQSKMTISTSCEPQERKRVSIEEKISKIRQKIIKSDQSTRKSAHSSNYFTKRQSKQRPKNIFEGYTSIKNQLEFQNRWIIKNSIDSQESRHKQEYSSKIKRCQESAPQRMNQQANSEFSREQSKPLLYRANPRVNSRINIRFKQEAFN